MRILKEWGYLMSFLLIEFTSDNITDHLSNKNTKTLGESDQILENSNIFFVNQKIFSTDCFHFSKLPIRKLSFCFTPGKKLINQEWAHFWENQFFNCNYHEDLFSPLKKRHSYEMESEITFRHHHENAWLNYFPCDIKYYNFIGWMGLEKLKFCLFLNMYVLEKN